MNLHKDEEEINWVVMRLLEERLRRRIWAWICWSWRVVLEAWIRDMKWVSGGF